MMVALFATCVISSHPSLALLWNRHGLRAMRECTRSIAVPAEP
jgi:hypothetical protein